MPSLSEQLQEARSQGEVCLYSGGRVVEVRAGVMVMAQLPLPPCSKYHHIAAETMVIENSFGSNRKERLSTALNILEKYGCNLTNPNRPKYWRTVKHNNPVFRATVDAIQGGRAVLCLYGYSNQQPDGLSFPDDVADPDVGKVAAITLEVMSLRMELEMLTKVRLLFDAKPVCGLFGFFFFPFNIPPCLPHNCAVCGIFRMAVHCRTCLQGMCCECDRVYHSFPERAKHRRTAVPSTTSFAPTSKSGRSQSSCFHCFNTEWQCKSCTVVNAAGSILCQVCERPRLATRPPLPPSHPPITPPRPPWVCQFCTYLNYSPATVCEMCDLARPEPAPLPSKLRPPSPVRRVPALPVRGKGPTQRDPNSCRQRRMKEDGLKLIRLIRDGEKNGVSPEEVYTCVRVAKDSAVLPCKWLKSELPRQLDEITKVAVQLSRAEAKQAWLTTGGDSERAARQALRERLAKVKMLRSSGFGDEAHCHEVLRQSGGEVRGALAFLQRPLLQPFHERIWRDEPEPALDIRHPDKQRICRRLLAVYDLPSWGRCELALSLLREHNAPYSLEDVVQAVRESHDREFIKRVLAKECPICLSVFPHSKMQSLTSCQCSVCCGCFQQHFTIAVRDKHIRDMVCPVCWEPDINDPEDLNSYFSTLDIQLRECLEADVYELFHKKLTEQALIKDPKFLWCCHVSSLKSHEALHDRTSPERKWESQHAGLSCEQYQSWKRENDPEYQKQGLAGYLRDNGITCPNCRFQYALSKGGCMHFCCSQCRYQFCSGCNNPFHTVRLQTPPLCTVSGLHAHHPRDCLFYLRDWEPSRLQALLENNDVAYNTEPPPGTQTGLCGVIEQKDDGGQQPDSACGAQTQTGHAGLCEKHYREYLVSLINSNSIDPARLYSSNELLLACRRYKVEDARRDAEDAFNHYSRLLEKLMDEVPLGDKVPRKK
uniref:Ring finger protein 31 n=1 Tax=Hippocampus comes TaxID=109280 RepID=A0A3Q2XVI1_HIPCM